MAADVAQRENSRIKRYASAFSNILIGQLLLCLYCLCLSTFMPLLPLPVHFPNSNIQPYGPHPSHTQQIRVTRANQHYTKHKDIKHSQHTKFTIHKTTNSQTDKIKMSNKVIKAIRHGETEKQRENLISVQRETERGLYSHSQSTTKSKM